MGLHLLAMADTRSPEAVSAMKITEKMFQVQRQNNERSWQDQSLKLQTVDGIIQAERETGQTALVLKNTQWIEKGVFEAKFAYMSKLLNTAEFVQMRSSEFDTLDANKSGTLEAKELETVVLQNAGLSQANLPPEFLQQVPVKQMTQDFLMSIDVDQNGTI